MRNIMKYVHIWMPALAVLLFLFFVTQFAGERASQIIFGTFLIAVVIGIARSFRP